MKHKVLVKANLAKINVKAAAAKGQKAVSKENKLSAVVKMRKATANAVAKENQQVSTKAVQANKAKIANPAAYVSKTSKAIIAVQSAIAQEKMSIAKAESKEKAGDKKIEKSIVAANMKSAISATPASTPKAAVSAGN